MRHYCLVNKYPIDRGGYKFWRSLMYPDPTYPEKNVYNNFYEYGGRQATVKDAHNRDWFDLKELKVLKRL